jgi:hypothetical protein
MNFATAVACAVPRLIFAAALFYTAPAFAQTSGNVFPNKSITIYVADFDLAATTAPSRPAASRAVSSPNPPAPANSAPASNTTTPASAATPAPTATNASTTSPAPSPDGRPDAPKPDATPADASNLGGTNNPSPTDAASTTGSDASANPPVPIPAGSPAIVATATASNPAATNAAANNAAPATPTAPNTATPGPSASTAASKKPDADSDDPRVRTAKFVDLTATTFVKSLEHAGYSVKRLRNSASAPDSGVVIRGVFAQVDPDAGIRRAVYGGTPTDPSMLLFVGVGNLAKPQQTLYQVVSPSTSGTLGPLIAVSAYAPISRYELAQEPSEDSLRHTADQFATDLTRLLNANQLAFGE